MERPTEFLLATSKWTIEYAPFIGEEAVGLCIGHQHTIFVDRTCPEDVVRETLFHELLHAIAWTYGFKPLTEGAPELEEAIVSFYTVPLLTVLRENPKLSIYLLN